MNTSTKSQVLQRLRDIPIDQLIIIRGQQQLLQEIGRIKRDIQDYWLYDESDGSHAVLESSKYLDRYLFQRLTNLKLEFLGIDTKGAGYISGLIKELNNQAAVWHVYLIDNPEGYLAGSKNYGCGITLVVDNQIYFGCIILPAHDRYWMALKDHGVWFNEQRVSYIKRNQWWQYLCVHSLCCEAKQRFHNGINQYFDYSKYITDTGSFFTEIIRVCQGTASLLLGHRIPFELYAPGWIIAEELGILKGVITPQVYWNDPLNIFFTGYSGNYPGLNASDFEDYENLWIPCVEQEIASLSNYDIVWVDKERNYSFEKVQNSNKVLNKEETRQAIESRILGEQISKFTEVFSV